MSPHWIHHDDNNYYNNQRVITYCKTDLYNIIFRQIFSRQSRVFLTVSVCQRELEMGQILSINDRGSILKSLTSMARAICCSSSVFCWFPTSPPCSPSCSLTCSPPWSAMMCWRFWLNSCTRRRLCVMFSSLARILSHPGLCRSWSWTTSLPYPDLLHLFISINSICTISPFCIVVEFHC